MAVTVTATRFSSGQPPRSCRCIKPRPIYVIAWAATFPGFGVGDGILARRASHTTRDIVTSQNGTGSPPLWRSRETMDIHYAHTGEEATGTQYIHPITRYPSIIVIGGQSSILTTLTRTDQRRGHVREDGAEEWRPSPGRSIACGSSWAWESLRSRL
jgi:hypothetical protein